MSNIGKVIKNSFCNGYFDSSHNYDLFDAVIIADGNDWVVVRRKDGGVSFAKGFKESLLKEWLFEDEDESFSEHKFGLNKE